MTTPVPPHPTPPVRQLLLFEPRSLSATGPGRGWGDREGLGVTGKDWGGPGRDWGWQGLREEVEVQLSESEVG